MSSRSGAGPDDRNENRLSQGPEADVHVDAREPLQIVVRVGYVRLTSIFPGHTQVQALSPEVGGAVERHGPSRTDQVSAGQR